MTVTLNDLLDNVHILTCSTRSIPNIAQEMGADEGAIINAIMCTVGGKPAMVLMAGDKACDAGQIGRVLNAQGAVEMMAEDEIAKLIGAGIDGLFPVELAERIPTVLDASLKRFDVLYSRAGSSRCLIATSFGELRHLTDGIISYAVASPTWHPRMTAVQQTAKRVNA